MGLSPALPELPQMGSCLAFPAGECSNKECPFLHIDPESKIKDCPWYDRGFCKHGRYQSDWAPSKRLVLSSSAHMTSPCPTCSSKTWCYAPGASEAFLHPKLTLASQSSRVDCILTYILHKETRA